jgi:uncharacterized protein YgbK (DUF1537 family)
LERRWLILADDLSGAADAGVAFALRGLITEVHWHRVRRDRECAVSLAPDVVAFDTDSRRLDAAAAAERQREALRRLHAPGVTLFKKMDSTLRGQPAAEIAAIHQYAGGRVVVAPANPAMGRITRAGRVWVHGQPLEQGETWRGEPGYPSADLGDILGSAGLHAIKLPLEVVRSPSRLAASLCAAQASPVFICDAENDADLTHIARAGQAPGATTLFAGSAGLAQALARLQPPRRFAPLDLRPAIAGSLIVVGSLSSISRGAAAELARSGQVRTVRVSGERLCTQPGELGQLGPQVADMLAAGHDVGVEIEPEPRLARGPALVRALAAVLEPARHVAGGLVATGGETAAALLDGWYFERIRLIDEVAPGMSLGVALGERQLPLVTKPGAFGDHASLLHALAALRRLRARI